jgi:hypothetical protein
VSLTDGIHGQHFLLVKNGQTSLECSLRRGLVVVAEEGAHFHTEAHTVKVRLSISPFVCLRCALQ